DLTPKQDGMGVAVIALFDCADVPVEGATVTMNPPAQKIFTFPPNLPPQENMPTAADGQAFATNITPGAHTVTAQYQGTTFIANHVHIYADALSVIILRP